MIDEKKLIKFIISNDFKRRTIQSKDSLQDILIQFVEEQPKVGEWIPVSERLPEDGESYLVTNAESFGQFHTYKGWYDGEHKIWHMDGNFERKMNVIAWQPLPEPYREKDDTERMTNADRIRSMTDEELGAFLRKVEANHQWLYPEFPDVCDDWAEWLQSEVEE